MKLDRNQIIGIVIIIATLGAYFLLTDSQPQQQPQQETSAGTTSTADTVKHVSQAAKVDSIIDSNKVANAPTVAKEELYTVNTEEFELLFSNFGGRIKSLKLKNHTTYKGDEDQIILFDEHTHNMSLDLPKANLNVLDKDVVFTTNTNKEVTVKPGDSTEISFVYTKGDEQIKHIYKLLGSGFEVWHRIETKGIKDTEMALNWDYTLKRTEEGLDDSRNNSWINYYANSGDFDDIVSAGDDEDELDEPVKWISMKQRFFNAGMIVEHATINKIKFRSVVDKNSEEYIKSFNTKGNIPLTNGLASFHYYFGPNDYHILENVGHDEIDYHKNAYMGWKLFSFINRFLVLPVFNVLEQFIPNYGIIILILVVIIKLLLFPIAYRSYLSMAKMKELKPAIDKIKEKHDGDMQKSQAETMALYREAGVNPLAGCIPMVLQMPIIFAMFRFFPNCFELRHQSFLWAEDLSTYDKAISWSTHLPIIGDHISIFTLLMTVSTLVYTYINNQSNTQAQGPVKAMGYAMPVVFFFVLNNYSSGLSFYYFVSNLITIGQQLIATRFIDKEKIRQTIEANRKKAASPGEGGGKKSKFQQRLDEALKASQEQRKNK